MKKTILLVAILSIVFIFSGCDALLESFFPKATGADRGEDAINTIEVGVYVEWDIFDSMEYRECYAPIIIQLERFDPETNMWPPMDRREIWCHWESQIYERFEWNPEGEYRVIVFFDRDNSFDLNWGDYNTVAFDYNAGGYDTVFVSDGGWYMLDAYIDTWSDYWGVGLMP